MARNNQPISEKELRVILEDYPTKSHLDQTIERIKNEIMNKLDYLIGKYEAAEEDRILAAGQTRDLRDDVEDHEKRIVNLEKKLSI